MKSIVYKCDVCKEAQVSTEKPEPNDWRLLTMDWLITPFGLDSENVVKAHVCSAKCAVIFLQDVIKKLEAGIGIGAARNARKPLPPPTEDTPGPRRGGGL